MDFLVLLGFLGVFSETVGLGFCLGFRGVFAAKRSCFHGLSQGPWDYVRCRVLGLQQIGDFLLRSSPFASHAVYGFLVVFL